MSSRRPGDFQGTRSAASRAADSARGAAREAAPWIERLARFGYAAKGAVYILIGVFAVMAATGNGGQASGSSGALGAIADSTWGTVLLALVAIGLAGYVVWRLVGAVLNPEHDSGGKRAFYVISGLVYGALAVEAARLVLDGGSGGSSGGGGGGAQHWTATLMQQPFGQVLVAVAGIAVGLYGLHQLYRAYSADVGDRLDLHALSASARRWTVRFGRFGLAARGVVLAMIGGFVLMSAMQADPSEARGLGGALRTLQQQDYGPWLLLIVALGLVAYGLYNLVRARYRRIQAH